MRASPAVVSSLLEFKLANAATDVYAKNFNVPTVTRPARRVPTPSGSNFSCQRPWGCYAKGVPNWNFVRLY